MTPPSITDAVLQALVGKCERATLAGNRQPAAAALVKAQALGHNIVDAVERREQVIASEHLDPAFAYPGANWHPEAPNDYLNAYRLMRTLKWEEIKNLRFRAQNFSGYSLLRFKRGPGTLATDPVPVDFDAQIPRWPSFKLLFYWRLLTFGLPSHLLFKPPPMLGEVGWWINGVLLNEDTAGYQERLSLLAFAQIFAQLPRRPRILEIGAGYGALATAILSAVPDCEYWICDLPESLLFSGLYLSLTSDDTIQLHSVGKQTSARINLVPNYLFPLLADRFDLVINTLSLSEMSEAQIDCYASGISKLIGETGAFFEQNKDSRYIGWSHCKPIIARYFTKKKRIRPPFWVRHGVADVWRN